MVELGYRGSGEILKREEFEAKKLAAEETRKAKLNPKPKKFASADKDLEGFPLLQALAQREELVRNGKLTTIIYIRDKNSKKQEVSGYIDYAHRLKSENWELYFERKKRVMPHTSDLSFYNWCARPPRPPPRRGSDGSCPGPSADVAGGACAGRHKRRRRTRRPTSRSLRTMRRACSSRTSGTARW